MTCNKIISRSRGLFIVLRKQTQPTVNGYLCDIWSNMSASYFVRKLESLSQDESVSEKDVKILAAKYLDKESDLILDDGRHIFSLLQKDIVTSHAMSYVIECVKHVNHPQLFYGVDADSFTPYHYAAVHGLDNLFYHVSHSRFLDLSKIRSLCLHVHSDSHHSVPSLLVAKDKKNVLERCMVDTLGISPFVSDFKDVYVTWLHETIACNASNTALYLVKSHREGMQKSLLETPVVEHASPLDVALVADHGNRSFYVDVILKGIAGGYKLLATPYEILLSRIAHLGDITTEDPTWFVMQCVKDSIAAKVHSKLTASRMSENHLIHSE